MLSVTKPITILDVFSFVAVVVAVAVSAAAAAVAAAATTPNIITCHKSTAKLSVISPYIVKILAFRYK